MNRTRFRQGRWAASLLVAGACTGDALLGAERPLPLDAGPTIAPVDAGTSVVDPPAPDAGAPQSTDAGLDSVPPRGGSNAPAPALSFHFEEEGAAITDIRTLCSRPCARVTVIPSGGVAPYLLRWSDGSTESERSLCPTVDSVWRVSVMDSAGHRVERALPASAPTCTSASSLCIENPSLEGNPVFGIAWFSANVWNAAGWDDCDATNQDATPSMPHVVSPASTLDDRHPFPAATDGSSYFYLEANARQHQYVGQHLCESLRAGVDYALQLDLASAPTNSQAALLGPAQLELYASPDACTRGELLWTSPLLGQTWQTYCVVLHPSRDAPALVLNPLGPMGSAAVLVDHLVPVDRCP
jgi:hypothetical protein